MLSRVRTLQARFQLDVHAQDMFFNPRADGLMQGAENIRTETLVTAAFIEPLKESLELLMRLFVLRVDGAAITFHAILFKVEMFFRVGLEKLQQLNQKFALFFRRVGFRQIGRAHV